MLLTDVINEMGNTFAENSKDLLVLDSRDLADPAVIHTLRQIKSLGQEPYDTYVSERLVNQTKPITDPFKRNNLPQFSRPPVREKSRAQLQLSSLKNHCSLFSRLYIASQIRSGNLDQFFQHENQAYPPALSQMGKLRTGTKSDLVGCLEDLVPTQDLSPLQSYKSSCLMGLQSLTCLDQVLQIHFPITRPKCSCRTSHRNCNT